MAVSVSGFNIAGRLCAAENILARRLVISWDSMVTELLEIKFVQAELNCDLSYLIWDEMELSLWVSFLKFVGECYGVK